jgi:hypothetical protein
MDQENGKCSIYTQWDYTQPQRRIKFCHLQVNGWNWRTSLSEVKQIQKAKSHVFSHMWNIGLIQIH